MPDFVIVTIHVEIGDFTVDMELPAQIPYGDFKDELVATVSKLFKRDYQSGKLFFGAQKICPDMTLAQAGAWDGSILILKG